MNIKRLPDVGTCHVIAPTLKPFTATYYGAYSVIPATTADRRMTIYAPHARSAIRVAHALATEKCWSLIAVFPPEE
jgi:hypothetical protein